MQQQQRDKIYFLYCGRISLGSYQEMKHTWGTEQYRELIHSIMAVQPFVGHWPLLQFRTLFSFFYTDGRTPLVGD
jgi:hypothetical protein